MHIKQAMLDQQLKKNLLRLYILIGQEYYLLEDSVTRIKTAIKNVSVCDEEFFSIQSSDEWKIITEKTENYSLFSELSLLTIMYDKKSLDATGKKVITQYLKMQDSSCHIIIQAPNIPIKQLQWLSNHEQAIVVSVYPLNPDAMKTWIKNQLQKNSLSCAPSIPDLIIRYTQNNMQACANLIEKLALIHEPNSKIEMHDVLDHLSEQSIHSLYELTDACLLGDSNKAVRVLRHAAANKTEITLVLWVLTQEIRILLQLEFQITAQPGVPFNNALKIACSHLKIWPQRIPLYQTKIKQINASTLKQMLDQSRTIDEQIKSSLNTQAWNALEQLALRLCMGNALCIQ